MSRLGAPLHNEIFLHNHRVRSHEWFADCGSIVVGKGPPPAAVARQFPLHPWFLQSASESPRAMDQQYSPLRLSVPRGREVYSGQSTANSKGVLDSYQPEVLTANCELSTIDCPHDLPRPQRDDAHFAGSAGSDDAVEGSR